jgi:hypothetical protein
MKTWRPNRLDERTIRVFPEIWECKNSLFFISNKQKVKNIEKKQAFSGKLKQQQ